MTQGWRGGWVEGNDEFVERIRKQFRDVLKTKQLVLVHSFITADNVVSLVNKLDAPTEFDFLSIDIDRNTPHVWKELKQFRPRVVAIEYNATFPADVVWNVPYVAERSWNRSCYFGASLKAMELLGAECGYALVGCDFSGSNAFFVHREEDLSRFAAPFTAEHHYEPARYWTLRNAHPRCFSD